MADAASLFKQAESAWRAGNGAAAKAAAEQVLADDPVHVGALMILANLCFATGDVAGARPHLERLAILMPDEVMIRNNLGRACLAAEDLGAAAEAFTTVLETAPANARALDGLGIVRHREGDYAEAA
ncbi:MAG TPA: hypothetical protein DEB21_11350, partial [Rhodospirillaceae bacterium]|nr:hypothetical protein [Rhodospirillaceae bacterium]